MGRLRQVEAMEPLGRRRFREESNGIGMITLMKLLAGAAIALGVLSPGFAPRADTCECKAKGLAPHVVPHSDTCECKAKTPS
jgi:hypothetical protein